MESLIEKVEKNRKNISILRNENVELEDKIKNILIQESGIKVNDIFETRGQKIYVSSIKLDNFSNDYSLRFITRKIKKDGTFGLAIDNSYGYRLKDLLEMEKI